MCMRPEQCPTAISSLQCNSVAESGLSSIAKWVRSRPTASPLSPIGAKCARRADRRRTEPPSCDRQINAGSSEIRRQKPVRHRAHPENVLTRGVEERVEHAEVGFLGILVEDRRDVAADLIAECDNGFGRHV